LNGTAWAPRLALACTFALALIELLWEMALAPLAFGGSWLALKALPLAVLLPGATRGRRRPRQWLSLLLPFYAAEAFVRAFAAQGRLALVAGTTCIIAIAAFVALLAWFRSESLRHRKDDPLDNAR
jgi:uncharacterized membrane protein